MKKERCRDGYFLKLTLQMVKSGAASYGCELTDGKEQQEEKSTGEEEGITTKVKNHSCEILNMR